MSDVLHLVEIALFFRVTRKRVPGAMAPMAGWNGTTQVAKTGESHFIPPELWRTPLCGEGSERGFYALQPHYGLYDALPTIASTRRSRFTGSI